MPFPLLLSPPLFCTPPAPAPPPSPAPLARPSCFSSWFSSSAHSPEAKQQWVKAMEREIKFSTLVYSSLPSSLTPQALTRANPAVMQLLKPLTAESSEVFTTPPTRRRSRGLSISSDATTLKKRTPNELWTPHGHPRVINILQVPPAVYLPSYLLHDLNYFRHHPGAILNDPVAAFSCLVDAADKLDSLIAFIDASPEAAYTAWEESQEAITALRAAEQRRQRRFLGPRPDEVETEEKVIRCALRSALGRYLGALKQSRERSSDGRSSAAAVIPSFSASFGQGPLGNSNGNGEASWGGLSPHVQSARTTSIATVTGQSNTATECVGMSMPCSFPIFLTVNPLYLALLSSLLSCFCLSVHFSSFFPFVPFFLHFTVSIWILFYCFLCKPQLPATPSLRSIGCALHGAAVRSPLRRPSV